MLNRIATVLVSSTPYAWKLPFRKKAISTIALCMLGASGSAYADCTAAPSGNTVSGDVLAPESNDTVTCDNTQTNILAISNDTATGVTVTVDSGATVRVGSKPTINLGEGLTLNNQGLIFSDQPGDRQGTITLRGTGNAITNSGTVRARGGEAIHGYQDTTIHADGVVLQNSGTIETINQSGEKPSSAIKLGDSAQITNSGTLTLNGGGQGEVLSVGSGSYVENQASGVIEALDNVDYQTTLSSHSLTALRAGENSTVVNAGTIRVAGSLASSGGGTAVNFTGNGGGTLTNTGTIDASMGHGDGVSANGTTTITNSGAISGGRYSISISNGNGSELTLQTGSQLNGAVQVQSTTKVPHTLEELGGSQRAYDICQQNPDRNGCYKLVQALATNTTLGLEGTGTEDAHFSGFSLIEKRGAGAWTLNSDFVAGSASDSYQSGDFRDQLHLDVQDAAGQLNLTGSISDNADGTLGQVAKSGDGTLVLSGQNTYGGATTISGGTLQAAGGRAIGDLSAVTVDTGATLVLNNNESIGSLAGAGDVQLGSATLTTGGNNASTTFDGSITGGGGLTKIGSGTQILAGTNSYTGATNVNSGTLLVHGSITSDALVGSGGTLGGHGTITGNVTVNDGGTLAPGGSVGTLTIDGDYAMSANSTLAIEIVPDGSAADLVTISSTASLAGTLAVDGENGEPLRPMVDGNTYTILTATGGVSGQFDTVQQLAAYSITATENPNDVELNIKYVGFSNSGKTKNQKTNASSLDQAPISGGNFNSGNSDFDKVLTELASGTLDEFEASLNSMIAEPYAAFNTVLLEQNDFYADLVFDRAQICSIRGRNTLGGSLSPDEAASDVSHCMQASGHRSHGAWVDATRTKGQVDGDNGLSGYDYELSGLVIGADTALGDNLAAGIAAGVGRSTLDGYDLANAEIKGDSYFLSTYATYTRDLWEFAGLLGYGMGDYDSTRHIHVGDINRVAHGNFDGDTATAALKAAYFYRYASLDVIPEAGLTYSKIWQDGFTESGANSLNLRVEDADAESTVTSIGVRVGTEFQRDDTRFRPQAQLRYDYDWSAASDSEHEVQSSFADVPSIGTMEMVGQNRGEHGIALGLGATVLISDNTNLFAGTGYRWNNNGTEYNFGAGARIAW